MELKKKPIDSREELMNKWILIVLVALLGLYGCAANRSTQDQAKVEKAEVFTKVSILPLKALDSNSRYITKILTVRDLELTFDKYAKYVLADLAATASEFKLTGYHDTEDLDLEDLGEISKNLETDVIITGNVSESRSNLFVISMTFYSPRSEELKQVSFNVGKEKYSRWKALDEGMMHELDVFVSSEMDKIFNIATNYYNNGNYTDAEKSLRQVVALKPDKVDAYYYLANTYVKTNRNELAEANFLKAYELNPTDQRSAIALIDLYEKTSQVSKRIAMMEKLAAANNDEELWLAVGNLYDQQGNKAKAKESFRNALTANPDYPTANVRLAFMLYDEGNFSESIPLLEKAFDQAPDNDVVSRRLATAYQKSGRTQDAIAKYEGLIANDPTNVNAYLNVIGLYRNIAAETSDSAVAAEMNRKALESTLSLKRVAPENPYAYLNLAAIYLSQNKYADAETNANLTISRNPSLYQPYVILSVVYQTRGTEAYNNYLDLDKQASKAVGAALNRIRTQRDAAKATANQHFRRAEDNLKQARNYATETEALNDINTRLANIARLIGQTQ